MYQNQNLKRLKVWGNCSVLILTAVTITAMLCLYYQQIISGHFYHYLQEKTRTWKIEKVISRGHRAENCFLISRVGQILINVWLWLYAIWRNCNKFHNHSLMTGLYSYILFSVNTKREYRTTHYNFLNLIFNNPLPPQKKI